MIHYSKILICYDLNLWDSQFINYILSFFRYVKLKTSLITLEYIVELIH